MTQDLDEHKQKYFKTATYFLKKQQQKNRLLSLYGSFLQSHRNQFGPRLLCM